MDLQENFTRHENDTSEDDGLITAKVVAMVCLGCTSMITGNGPVLVARYIRRRRGGEGLNLSPRGQLIVSLLLSFGGGALMSTTFLHLLPEVNEAVEKLQSSGAIPETSFHLTEVIMCCGFFTIYLVEELIHLYIDNRQKSKDSTSLVECGHIDHEEPCSHKGRHSDSKSDHSGEFGSDNSMTSSRDKLTKIITATNPPPDNHLGHSHVPLTAGSGETLMSSVRGFLLVLALSIHELFEGLAVGLESRTSDTWYMLAAVAAHKLVISFCVGVELVSAEVKTWLSILYITTFSLVTPLGIGVGIALSEESGQSVADSVPNTVLQGMATGTLLYVVFFEILQKQRATGHNDIRQMVAIMVGFGIMFGLLVAVGDHDHDG